MMALGIVTLTPEHLAPLIAPKDLVADRPMVRPVDVPGPAPATSTEPERETAEDYAPGTTQKLLRTLRAKRLQLQRMDRMSHSRLFRHFVSADYLGELANEIYTYEDILARTFGHREAS